MHNEEEVKAADLHADDREAGAGAAEQLVNVEQVEQDQADDEVVANGAREDLNLQNHRQLAEEDEIDEATAIDNLMASAHWHDHRSE